MEQLRGRPSTDLALTKTRVISEKLSTHGTPDKDIWLSRWDVGGNIREEKCSRWGEGNSMGSPQIARFMRLAGIPPSIGWRPCGVLEGLWPCYGLLTNKTASDRKTDRKLSLIANLSTRSIFGRHIYFPACL